MNELVRHKNPANQPGTVARLTHERKDVLLRELRRRSAAGQVATAGDLYLIQRGPHAGQYAVDVHLIPREADPAPAWARASRALGWVLLSLAALVGSFAYLLSTLSAAALALTLGTLLAAFCTWVWVRYGRRSRGVNIEAIMSVRIR